MVLEFVYESRTDQIRSEPIPQLIFGLIYLLILTRFIWPLQLPLSIKIVVAALALVALQFLCMLGFWVASRKTKSDPRCTIAEK